MRSVFSVTAGLLVVGANFVAVGIAAAPAAAVGGSYDPILRG